jgi:predicted permease
MLTESGILAMTGAFGGLLLASWVVPLLNRTLADHPERPFWMVIDIDYLVLAVAAGVTLGVGLLAGLFPALRSTRPGTVDVLKDIAVGGPGLRVGRLNRVLVVTQVAVSCAVLVATGVLVDGMRKSTKTELPFNPDLILSADVRPDSPDFKTASQRLAFYAGLLERVRALPGVKNATITQSYPFDRMGRSSVEVFGTPMSTEVEAPRVFFNRVASGFFRDLQLPLREGREFDDRDGPKSEPVAIVSESFARRFWPGESALGKRLRKKANASAASADGWMTVVGVAPDLPIGTPDRRQGLHVPLSQDPFSAITLLLTATRDPKPLSRPLRDAVRSLSPDAAVDLVQTLGERGSEDRRLSRMLGALTLVFGVSALLLAAVGVYGVTSFAVQRRTREFGVRMALGARPLDVLALVFKQGALQLLVGLFAGTFGGWLISRPLMHVLASMAEPTGPLVYLLVFSCVGISMAYALWWPARRAAKVDPLVALRYE